MKDDDLEMLFALSRHRDGRQGEGVSSQLNARVLGDAFAHLPSKKTVLTTNLWRQLIDSLGGWRFGMGLTAGAALGMVLGYMGPIEAFGPASAAEFELIPITEPFFAQGEGDE